MSITRDRQTRHMGRGDDPPVPELPRDRVEAGLRALTDSLEPGALLPPSSELAARWGVSKAVVSRAIRKLADEGVLVTMPGYGTAKA